MSKKALTPEERQEMIAEIIGILRALGLVTDSDTGLIEKTKAAGESTEQDDAAQDPADDPTGNAGRC